MIAELGYYDEQQYNLLLRYADDRKSLHDTWKEWLLEYEKAYSNLTISGLKVKKIEVDINHLLCYCHKQGLKNTGETRSKYIQAKVSGEIP
jgi:hypothetical protein